MPFCPKCKAEYEVGIRKCSDCDIPLVNSLSKTQPVILSDISPDTQPENQDEESRDAEIVSLCIVTNELEAILFCDLLKQAGIESSYRASPLSMPTTRFLQEGQNNYLQEILVLDNDYDAAKQFADDYFKSLEENKESPDIEP